MLQTEIEKHQAEERKLIEKRRDLEAKGIKLPEVAGHQGSVHGVLAPGYNPKETPEMFVDKIMRNRKRMEYTIKKFEEKEKAKLKEALKSLSDVPADKQPVPNPAVDAS